MKPSPRLVEVSDHAALRYLERVAGVDVALIKRKLRKKALNAARLGASGVQVDGVHLTLVYHLDGSAVVTTTLQTGGPLHKLRQRQRRGRAAREDNE